MAVQTVVTVKAVSQADTTKSASAMLTINPVSVSVSPPSTTLAGGEIKTFAASVQNTFNTAVNWLVNDIAGGDITSVGSISGTGVYTAPATVTAVTTVTVKAISQADSTKIATATVTLNPVSLGLDPGPVTLGAAGSHTFVATVQNASNTAVTWYVNDVLGGDAAATGTITAGGIYTAPGSIAAQATVTVKATSQADSTKSATVQVTLNPVAINVSPNPITLGAGATQPFVANVQYAANAAVTWYVNDIAGGDLATVGSISDQGLYTSPAAVATQSIVVMIKAKSQADNTKSATVQVTLSPVTVTVSPSGPTVGILKTKQFSANVQYTTNTAVNWQVNGVEGGDDTNGHITTAGLYTAPATVPDPATVTVTAVSQADTAQSGFTQVTISAATGNSYYLSHRRRHRRGNHRAPLEDHLSRRRCHQRRQSRRHGLRSRWRLQGVSRLRHLRCGLAGSNYLSELPQRDRHHRRHGPHPTFASSWADRHRKPELPDHQWLRNPELPDD